MSDFTNVNFWDCACDDHYVHPKTCKDCPRCGATPDDQPDAMQEELDRGEQSLHCQCQKRVLTNGTYHLGQRVEFTMSSGFPVGGLRKRYPDGGTVVGFIDANTVRLAMADGSKLAFFTNVLEKIPG